MGSLLSFAQSTKSALFIGNSYTSVNNLPQLVANLAASEGNQLIIDANAPGGYQLIQHATNPTTLSKIIAKKWDFVIIQEQSQKPSFPDQQVATTVYPYAAILVDSIRSNFKCSVPLFYDTWGRENGDSQWVGINTFEKMNNRLYNAYQHMANEAKGMLSPVGIAYAHIKNTTNPTVTFTELYQGDESHPTILGSYLCACIFNNLIFSTSSVGNTYLPNGVNNAQAEFLQSIADHVVYAVDSVRTDYRELSENSFSSTTNGSEVTFTGNLQNGNLIKWLFGDTNFSTTLNPTHQYATAGTYVVRMITTNGCYTDTTTKEIIISTTAISKPSLPELKIYPNPVQGNLHVSFATSPKRITLRNINGDLLFKTINNNISIPLQSHPSGIYILSIGNISRKIIKED